MLIGKKEKQKQSEREYSSLRAQTVAGRLTKFSSLVWLNSKLMTLYSFSLWEGGVS